MELRHLRYFVAVAEERNFSRAARKLHIAQPPLSQQIRALEEELSVELLRRNNRGVELTNAGKHFLEEARQILARSERARHFAHRAALGQIGSLQIACAPIASFSVLPHLLSRFRSDHPDIDLQVHDLLPDPGLDALIRGTVDLVMGFGPFEAEGIVSEDVFQDDIMLAVSNTHHFVRASKISVRDCKDEPFVIIARSSFPRAYENTLAICRRAGYHPKIAHQVHSLYTQLILVSAGFGVALLPSSAKIVNAGVSFLTLASRLPPVSLSIAWRKGDTSPILKAFLQLAHRTPANIGCD